MWGCILRRRRCLRRADGPTNTDLRVIILRVCEIIPFISIIQSEHWLEPSEKLCSYSGCILHRHRRLRWANGLTETDIQVIILWFFAFIQSISIIQLKHWPEASEKLCSYPSMWACVPHRRRRLLRALCPAETEIRLLILRVCKINQLIQ